MTRKLNDQDRAAVDMMFDRLNTLDLNTIDGAGSGMGSGNGMGNGNGHPADSFVAMAPPVDDQRLQSVERILSMLDQMPAAEPPTDLATRTLQRIARTPAAAVMGAEIPAMPAFIDPTQPMA